MSARHARKPKPEPGSRDPRDAAPTHAPAHADPATWNDPNDTLRTRRPREVRGYRRGDLLALLQRRGNREISTRHVEAARLFRVEWDVARYGLTGTGQGTGIFVRPSPRSGPTAADHRRELAKREVDRVLLAVGTSAVPLLLWVVILNRDVKSWCDEEAKRLGETLRPDPKKVFGRLLAVLDRLAEHFRP